MVARAAQWVVQVDRQAVAVWRSLLGDGVALGPEVGEGVVPVRFAAPVEAAVVRAGGLPRAVHPVELVFPLTACRHEVAPELAEALRGLARKGGAAEAWVVPVRRHGRFAAGRLAAWAGEVLGGAAEGAGAQHAPDESSPPAGSTGAQPPQEKPSVSTTRAATPRLVITVSDDTALAGVIAPLDAGTPWPGGFPAERTVTDGPSRARGKVAEALDLLAFEGADLRSWPRWLELGAFPGGMTTELSQRGYTVTAVDVAPASDAMRALPGVTCVTADAEHFTPTAPFDALLCDVNGPPLVTARTVAQLARALTPGGLVLFTLKLPRWEQYPELLALTTALLADAGVTSLTPRHLWHNRQEVTLIGRTSGPARGA